MSEPESYTIAFEIFSTRSNAIQARLEIPEGLMRAEYVEPVLWGMVKHALERDGAARGTRGAFQEITLRVRRLRAPE